MTQYEIEKYASDGDNCTISKKGFDPNEVLKRIISCLRLGKVNSSISFEIPMEATGGFKKSDVYTFKIDITLVDQKSSFSQKYEVIPQSTYCYIEEYVQSRGYVHINWCGCRGCCASTNHSPPSLVLI